MVYVCIYLQEYLHIYGIDNVLTKSLDPVFLGLCIERRVACGNKVVWRANASEKVGVTVQSEGKMHIIEYSEIPTDMRDAADENGRLIFGAANICNHFLTVPFIVDAILPNLSSNYHSASKKIPYMDPVSKETVNPTQNNGVKLEMFIFDVFPLAQNSWLVVEGDREDEFAPVKNEPGNPQDSPDTALKAISDQGINILSNNQSINQSITTYTCI
jgi:UDP-N-acetylglucosamine/UDP-N-acetylgalactosamine diphosphorylase